MISELLTECTRIIDEAKTIATHAGLKPGYPTFQFYTDLPGVIRAILDGSDHLRHMHTWTNHVTGTLFLCANFGLSRDSDDTIFTIVAEIKE